jgi:hypothetical protein
MCVEEEGVQAISSNFRVVMIVVVECREDP